MSSFLTRITRQSPAQTCSTLGLLSSSQSRGYLKVLRPDTLSANVKECQYAVRGAIPMRGEEIRAQLRQGHGDLYPFQATTPMNIGNPQAVGQGFISYNREIMSTMLYPPMAETNAISDDAKETVRQLQSHLSSPMGAYTANSKGHMFIREAIASYIEKRDGPAVKANWNNIYMTNGASEGVRTAFKLLIRDQRDGVLVPIPQYPLYSALLTLDGGTMVKYYLEEDKNWGVNADDVQARIANAKDLGINLRAIVVINPGNPTGNVMRREDIESIIKIAHENSILIIADEVYQTNIYTKDAPFISFRKVLAEMGEPYSDAVELLSLHSVSKGLLGECGLRGGYFEAHNLDVYASDMLYKLKSIELCSNTVGQLAAYLMVNPPQEGKQSSACIEQYQREYNGIFDGLKERARLLTETFNAMDNTSCNKIEGAMYAFPQVHFSDKALAAANKENVPADFLYCMDMVNETGIMTVPGSGFGQRENSYHYRVTNLVTPTERLEETLNTLRTFNEKFHDKYA